MRTRKSTSYYWQPVNWTALLASDAYLLLSLPERGVLLGALALSWARDGLPVERSKVVKLLGLAPDAECHWDVVSEYFPEVDGKLRNEEQELDRPASVPDPHALREKLVEERLAAKNALGTSSGDNATACSSSGGAGALAPAESGRRRASRGKVPTWEETLKLEKYAPLRQSQEFLCAWALWISAIPEKRERTLPKGAHCAGIFNSFLENIPKAVVAIELALERNWTSPSVKYVKDRDMGQGLENASNATKMLRATGQENHLQVEQRQRELAVEPLLPPEAKESMGAAEALQGFAGKPTGRNSHSQGHVGMSFAQASRLRDMGLEREGGA